MPIRSSYAGVRRQHLVGVNDGNMLAQQIAKQIAERLEQSFAWVELAKIDIDGLDVWVQLEHSYPEGIDIQTEVRVWVTAELARMTMGLPPPVKVKVRGRPCAEGAHREGARVLSW